MTEDIKREAIRLYDRFTHGAMGRRDSLGTFHGFRGVESARNSGRIDWILMRGPASFISSDIITDARNGQLPSDHFPVVARVRLTASPGDPRPPAAMARPAASTPSPLHPRTTGWP